MNQQSQQPTATGAGAQSTSAPSQSVNFASPRSAGKISRFQELSTYVNKDQSQQSAELAESVESANV